MTINRDEFFERPTSKPFVWDNGTIASQDLLRKGTWLAINPRTKKGAVLTNFMEPIDENGTVGMKSRGDLALEFVNNHSNPYSIDGSQYDGFNLICLSWDSEIEVRYMTNRSDRNLDNPQLNKVLNWESAVSVQSKGIHGLSNGTLFGKEHWPKVQCGKSQFENVISELPGDDMYTACTMLTQTVMSDNRKVDDVSTLPNTRISSKRLLHLVSAIKIDPFSFEQAILSDKESEWLTDLEHKYQNNSKSLKTPKMYGTRSTSVVLIRREDKKGIFFERSYVPSNKNDQGWFEELRHEDNFVEFNAAL